MMMATDTDVMLHLWVQLVVLVFFCCLIMHYDCCASAYFAMSNSRRRRSLSAGDADAVILPQCLAADSFPRLPPVPQLVSQFTHAESRTTRNVPHAAAAFNANHHPTLGNNNQHSESHHHIYHGYEHPRRAKTLTPESAALPMINASKRRPGTWDDVNHGEANRVSPCLKNIAPLITPGEADLVWTKWRDKHDDEGDHQSNQGHHSPHVWLATSLLRRYESMCSL